MVTPGAHRIFWALVIFFASVRAPILAQDTRAPLPESSFRFERLDGLSHNTVLSILQDHQGYLWVGTTDGLNRYDGYEFVVYRHDPVDSTSLSNNIIKALVEDEEGTLWVGTDGGLNRLDRQAERFIRYSLEIDSTTVHQQAVLNLVNSQDGALWIGTNRRGLYRLGPGEETFEVYRHEPADSNSLAFDGVWSLYETHDGVLWASTRSRVLHRFDPDARHFQRYVLPAGWDLTTLLYDDEAGRLWINSYDPKQVALFDPVTGQVNSIMDAPVDPFYNVFLEDDAGVLWIGAEDGLYRHDPTTGAYAHLQIDGMPGAYLPNVVRRLYRDRVGILWIGTLSGLYRLDPHAKPFSHYRHDSTNPNSLSSNTVMSILETTDGQLWMGTLGGGLNQVNRETGSVARFQHQAKNARSLCNDLIWSLFEDKQGLLWVGTDEGLCVLDRRTGWFSRYDLPLDSTETVQPPIHAIKEDQTGQLWTATLNGLFQVDPHKRTATKWYPSPSTESDVIYKIIQAVHIDRTGALWFGTLGGLLYRLDLEAGTFTRYPLLISAEKELVSEGIWAIHEDQDGTLWLGSDLGLTRFDPQSSVSTHFGQQDGLPGSIVYGILEDDQYRLWLSTNQGLSRFDERLPEGQQFRNYDSGDGLQNTEFNRRAAFKSQRGAFLFGGLEGLTAFYPEQIQDNPHLPPVVLTQIQTSNRDTTLTVTPYGLEQLVLSYRDYAVSFEFAALNYTNPSQNRYAYWLEGFDEAWQEVGTRRFANYTNIPPGDYVFHAKGSNDDGLWNEAGVALPITVTPPFWQRWWFRLLVLGLIIGLLTAAYRYRVARLIEIERMRLRIASDLHDDIGSNLSSIALLSDMVRDRERLGVRERQQLSKISNSARTMVDALRDIVWSIDPEFDQMEDLIQRMRDTAAALLTDTRHTFRSSENNIGRALDVEIRRHVFLMYKEILHNIARHAQATEVAIDLEAENGLFKLAVSDDGIGFVPLASYPGTGLKHLKERTTAIGGTLQIQSQPGEGTLIQLTIPLRSRRGVFIQSDPLKTT